MRSVVVKHNIDLKEEYRCKEMVFQVELLSKTLPTTANADCLTSP